MLAAVVFHVIGGSLSAQTDLERFERRMEQIRRDQIVRVDETIPVDRRVALGYGAFASWSFFSLDDRRGDNHALREYDLTAYARLNLDDVHEIFARVRTSYDDFNDGDSFDGRGDQWIRPDLERGYWRFDSARAASAYRGKEADTNLVVKAGRDLAYWANGLTLATPLDGLLIDFTSPVFEVQAIAGVTPVRTVDFDASRPDFDHNTRRGLYGAMAAARIAGQRLYAYGLIQRDYNEHDRAMLAGADTRFEYDSSYLGVGLSGSIADQWLYGIEAVYEGGRALSSSIDVSEAGVLPIEQRHETISAWAADLRIDYVPGDARRTRFTAELVLASGDPDRLSSTSTLGGNRPGTKDHGFIAPGLINTGLAFAPPVSNLLAGRLGVSTFPFTAGPLKRLQIGVDVLVFAKLQADAPIDEPTADQRYLGWEPDVFINWQITSDICLALRYGVFFPSSSILSDDSPRQAFLATVTYAF